MNETYKELFEQGQEKGKYHVFTFDVVNSKKMQPSERAEAQEKIVNLSTSIYKKLKEIEIRENRKVLLTDSDFPTNRYYSFGLNFEPFIWGDTFGFTVIKDSISKEEALNIYNEEYKRLNISFDFHLADCYYETNHYEEGGNKYFRGYAIAYLSQRHKEINIKKLKRSNNERKKTK